MRPQLMSCASIVRTEVDGVANDLVHEQACVAAARPAVDIGHLPCGMIGGIVRPQFKARASVISGEIDGMPTSSINRRLELFPAPL